MVGLSLSHCIRDIIYGKVQEGDVEKIIAGTMARNSHEFEEVLNNYAEDYWWEYPMKARTIAKRLYKQGKIEQPRLSGGEARNIADGHWLMDDKQVHV